jgi:hypothetical protein
MVTERGKVIHPAGTLGRAENQHNPRARFSNQNQTFCQEIAGGYPGSPKRNANGARNPFYESMREPFEGIWKTPSSKVRREHRRSWRNRVRRERFHDTVWVQRLSHLCDSLKAYVDPVEEVAQIYFIV